MTAYDSEAEDLFERMTEASLINTDVETEVRRLLDAGETRDALELLTSDLS